MSPSTICSLLGAVPLALIACGDNGNKNPDAGEVCTTSTVSGMGVLQDFCQAGDPGPNGFLITASGEVLALTGYRFPPANPGDFALVDGWDITFDRVLVTFDHVTLSSDPDKSATDESQTGPVVAEVDGPFAIDLNKGGPLVGKEGPPEQAMPIATLTTQNRNGNAAFDPSVRYAFGFDIVPATAMAQNVNLDAADLTEYQQMVSDGCTTLVVGTAVWKGNNDGALPGGCTKTVVAPDYDFGVIPKTVKVHFCFKAPTSYVNAQNPENDPAAAFANEEHQRGVHTVQNQSTVAQTTFHLDHFLWESFVHDSPPHFDQFAAKYAGMTMPTAKLEDYRGYALKPFVDAQAHQLPWRNCIGASYAPPGPGAMTFDTVGVPVNPTGTCDATGCNVIRDFYDYATYNHSTYGHLNADGLAFVDRHYPSPP